VNRQRIAYVPVAQKASCRRKAHAATTRAPHLASGAAGEPPRRLFAPFGANVAYLAIAARPLISSSSLCSSGESFSVPSLIPTL